MKKALIDAMRGQMTPSPAARAALTERLAQVRPRQGRPLWKYGTLAACAALVIGGFSLYQAARPRDMPDVRTIPLPLHSYVLAENGVLTIPGQEAGLDTRFVTENTSTGAGAAGQSTDLGDRDADMTPEELEEQMAGYGFSPEEIEEYQSTGYQMTWAKWWRYVHQTQDTGREFTLEFLKEFSRRELYVTPGALPAPNTGDLPGGAYVGDASAQEESVAAYQKLMERFDGRYPDWYGGAYLDGSGNLVVLLVSSEDPGDKTLELQVLDWTGSGRVAFGSAKYALSQLNGLMGQLNRLPDTDPACGAVMAGWGIDEEHNRIELALTEINDHILSVLARLDPADDMILVQVGQRAGIDVAHKLEEPAGHTAQPGGATAPDTDNAIAYEPANTQGASYDLLPQDQEENTSAHDPLSSSLDK